MSAVVVRHSQGSYPVYVEPGILGRLGELVGEHLPERRIAMIADETVLRLYRSGRLGESRWDGEALSFPAGEQSKTRETWGRLTVSSAIIATRRPGRSLPASSSSRPRMPGST